MNAYLRGIQYHLPEGIRTNEDLVALNPTWNAEKIFKSTGIRSRRIAKDNETAGDLAAVAAEKLFDELNYDRSKIDVIFLCTQFPDYFMPATACILQEKLGLSKSCAAFDISMGCSGFTYCLWLARAMILSESARNILLLIGDVTSRYCNVNDKTTAVIFGDGGAAILISEEPDNALAKIGPSILGTDGRGVPNLIIPAGCSRRPCTNHTKIVRKDDQGYFRNEEQIYLNGPEILSFALNTIPAEIGKLLEKVGVGFDDIDLFLLHQANRFILEAIRSTMGISEEKLPIELEEIGNLGGASLPVLLRQCLDRKLIQSADRCVLAGFGVGYSWALTFMTF